MHPPRQTSRSIGSLMKKRYLELAIWLELVDRRVNLVEEGFDLDVRVGALQESGLIAHHIAVSPRVLCAATDLQMQNGFTIDLRSTLRISQNPIGAIAA
jgi:hypothetical protein